MSSGLSSRAMSTSPFSSNRRRPDASGTWRSTTRFIAAGARWPSKRSRVRVWLGVHLFSLKMPEPASLVLSQPLPKSLPWAFSVSNFLSTTDAGQLPKIDRTKVGASLRSVVTDTVLASTSLTFCNAVSLVRPMAASTTAEPLPSSAVRCSDQATSSAVTGLPEWNFCPARILKVKVLPSSLTDQDSAASPSNSPGLARLARIRRS